MLLEVDIPVANKPLIETQASFTRYRHCHRHTEKPTLPLPLSVMDYTERGMNWKLQRNNVHLAKRDEGCTNE